jgi:hypothetical protein
MSIMRFNSLIETIQQTHLSFRDQSVKAANIDLTLRNWLIGFYIVEFEQNGDDRAKYGTSLIANRGKSIITAPELSRCRQFYKVYPDMFGSLTQKLLSSENNLINSIFLVPTLLRGNAYGR